MRTLPPECPRQAPRAPEFALEKRRERGQGHRQVQYRVLGQRCHRLGVWATELQPQLSKPPHPSADAPQTAPEQGEVKQLMTLAESIALVTVPSVQPGTENFRAGAQREHSPHHSSAF